MKERIIGKEIRERGSGISGLGVGIMHGEPVSTPASIIAKAMYAAIFLLAAFWRFRREEF